MGPLEGFKEAPLWGSFTVEVRPLGAGDIIPASLALLFISCFLAAGSSTLFLVFKHFLLSLTPYHFGYLPSSMYLAQPCAVVLLFHISLTFRCWSSCRLSPEILFSLTQLLFGVSKACGFQCQFLCRFPVIPHSEL